MGGEGGGRGWVGVGCVGGGGGGWGGGIDERSELSCWEKTRKVPFIAEALVCVVAFFHHC